MTIHTAAVLVVGALAAACDLRFRRIPNWLTMGGLALGLALHITGGQWMSSLQGIGLALLVHLPLFALRVLGGGDVKLMMAIGALVGPRHWLTIFAFNAVLGGLFALILVWRKRRFRQTLASVGEIVSDLAKGAAPERDLRSPDALAIPRGAVAALAIALWVLIE
jgi:prepilin peptidase CpaA